MRKILRKAQLVIVVLYVFIVAYFAIFNWPIFSVSLKADLGFSILQFPVVAMGLTLGLLILLLSGIEFKFILVIKNLLS